MKFKSLTMRIWVTFTTVILNIISITSLLYFIAFRMADENVKMQEDLKRANEEEKSFLQSISYVLDNQYEA